MFVFDGSGSMWGQIDGQAKIVTARETLARVATQLPPDLEVGLVAYGHNRKGDCNDIETLVPIGPAATRSGALVSSVQSLNPKGKTPLTKAVRRAADALRFQEDKATVILITDGIETCEADPCAVASELEALGIDFTAHVIGFGLTAEESGQVACLAENTGGLFLNADDAASLGEALQQTVALAPAPGPAAPAASLSKNLSVSVSLEEGAPALTDADGVRVFWTAVLEGGGEEINLLALPSFSARLEPGAYQLTARTDRGSSASERITVSDTEMTEVNLVLGAGQLDLAAIMANQDIQLSDVDYRWDIENRVTGETFSAYTQNLVKVVPSGQYRASLVITRLDKMSPGSVDIDVVTGKTVQAEIIAATSKVLFRAFNRDGSELTTFDVRFQIYKGDSTENNDEFVAMRIGGDPILLLPGRYAVRVEAWDKSKRDPVVEVVEVSPAADLTVDLVFP
ncbi:VWA domain-containing protein [Roseibium sp. MMSF_3412]|uniref:vWA domain-containing protein n=1 Tax=Roseibium sp. MMSF_3412 TaxID=3046712 RepID=UPI00273D71C8|nr:VWA domain-containing protein [Roseibium sp. MMSF_3412]